MKSILYFSAYKAANLKLKLLLLKASKNTQANTTTDIKEVIDPEVDIQLYHS
jgi:hypothetical protein